MSTETNSQSDKIQQFKSKPNLQSKQHSIVEMEPGSSMSMSARQTSRHDDKQRKIGHRRINEDGMVTYKKKTTTELMSAIQLGIGQSITSMSAKQKRDLLLHDFSIVETVTFPKDGSQCTPNHDYSDFRFKTYAPVAFRYFRELFGIQPDDFLISMCNDPLKELSNPGASGSIFYISEDDEFIIKTVSNKEADFLQKLLPGYYMNLNQNPRTLLPKFYGLFCYQCGGKNIRFVVMNNLLPMSVNMHEKYDLKGSTYKRRASKQEREKKSPTLKDLDFRSLHTDGIMLEADTFNALLKTIERDCRVLQSFQIMDYSLLMSVHNLDRVLKEKESTKDSPPNNNSTGDAPESKSVSRGKSLHQRLAHFSTTMEAIHAKSEPLEIDENQVPMGGIPARNQSGERLLLFIGLIDILQSYRLAKKFEHAVKAVVHDGDTISVHRPGFYAQRFQAFFNSAVFRKIPSLDQPQVKGAVRFKKLVQIVRVVTDQTVKHSSPIQKKIMERKALLAANGRPDVLPSTKATSTTGQAAETRSGVSNNNNAITNNNTFPKNSIINTLPATFTTPNLAAATATTATGELLHRVISPSLTIASNSTPTHPSEGTPSSFTASSPSCSITSTPGHSTYIHTDTHTDTHTDIEDYIESNVDEGLGRLSRETQDPLKHQLTILLTAPECSTSHSFCTYF